MKKEDVEKLELGIYKINWIMCQGFSIASIGMLANGEKWIAPTNWTEPELNQGVWDKIESVELIISQFDFKKGGKIQSDFDRMSTNNTEEIKGIPRHSMQDIKLKFIGEISQGRCVNCALDYDNCSTQCGDRGFFEFRTEEPKKIQSKFEWMKERLSLLKIRPTESGNYTHTEIDDLAKEEFESIKWLKDNQPEDWQECTTTNTSAGDYVKYSHSGVVRLVEGWCKDGRLLLYNSEENQSFVVRGYANYKINLAEKSDCLTKGDG